MTALWLELGEKWTYPSPYLNLMSNRVQVPGVGPSMHRAHLYFATCVMAAVASGLGSRLIAGSL